MMLLLLSACGGYLNAPFGSQVQYQDSELDISFSGDFKDVDGNGFLVRNQLIVVGPDGLPLNDVAVTVTSGFAGAYLLPETAVTEVTQFREDCSTGDASAEECAVFYGLDGEEYHELSDSYEYFDDLQADIMIAETNNLGALPLYLFFDYLPDGETVFTIDASINIAADTWEITASQGEE